MSHTDPLTVVVKGILSQKNISGRELARRTGIKPATINRRLNSIGPWKIRELEAVAAALDMKPSELYDRTEQVPA